MTLKKILRKHPKIKIVLTILFLAYIFIWPKQNPKEQESILLSSCVDGDTANFIVDGKKEKVRFLAIDAPETAKNGKPSEPYADDSKDFVCKALKNSKDIRLEYEQDKYDKYDRLLAWVFVDDKLLQEKVVLQGYAQVKYLYDDYKYTNIVQVAQALAQNEKVGIWSDK
ncbi:MAG: thermonuclease family protein [Anaerorhabdus sp.]